MSGNGAGLLALGAAAGVLSGLVGIGGGVLIVPCLVLFFGMSQQTAQGTTLAMLLPPIGAVAVWTYYQRGLIDFRAAAVLVAGFLVGSFFGAKLAVSLSNDTLRKVFGAAVILIGVKMVSGK
jgi:uncharacterized protein